MQADLDLFFVGALLSADFDLFLVGDLSRRDGDRIATVLDLCLCFDPVDTRSGDGFLGSEPFGLNLSLQTLRMMVGTFSSISAFIAFLRLGSDTDFEVDRLRLRSARVG